MSVAPPTGSEQVNAEIIAVGSELLTPARIDTNSLYLTGELNTLGVEVVLKCVVGDDRARLAEMVGDAARRSGIVILSGGLGPTEDDLTRDSVAQALGRSLEFRQDVCDAIEERFRRAGRKMAEINKRQAYVVEDAEVLPNDRGTAPGQWLKAGSSIVILLPGPPHELKTMFTRECLPRLERVLPKQVIRTRLYRVTGLGESDLDHLIAPAYTRYTNPVTTVLAAPSDIQVHLRCRCSTADEAERLLAELGGEVEALLGDRIYSSNGDSLPAVVGGMLRDRGETVSVAESCTAGLLAERITSLPGSSDYMVGGFVTYSNRMKAALLGVPPAMLDEHGPVSAPVAEAMAQGARERTGATYAISTTGVAGPGGGTEDTPVGTVYLGLASVAGVTSRRVRYPGDRDLVRAMAAQGGLDLLRRAMLQT